MSEVAWHSSAHFDTCMQRLLRGVFIPIPPLRHLLRGPDYAELERLVHPKSVQSVAKHNEISSLVTGNVCKCLQNT